MFKLFLCFFEFSGKKPPTIRSKTLTCRAEASVKEAFKLCPARRRKDFRTAMLLSYKKEKTRYFRRQGNVKSGEKVLFKKLAKVRIRYYFVIPLCIIKSPSKNFD